MAAQIIQGPGTLGAALASGLGSGLNNLLQSKLDGLSQRNKINQTAQGLRAIDPSMSQEQSQQMAPLPESYVNQYLKNNANQKTQQQETSLFNFLESLRNQQQPALSAFGDENQPNNQSNNNPQANNDQEQQTPFGVQSRPPQSRSFQIPQGMSLGNVKAPTLINTIETLENNRVKQGVEQEKLKMKREETSYRRMQDNQTANKERFGTEIKRIQSSFRPAQKSLGLAVNQLELLQSGKIPTGPLEGRLGVGLAGLIENPELSEYVRDINQYIVNKFGDTTGIKSKAFLQKLEDAKVKSTDPLSSQMKFWEGEAKENKKQMDTYNANQDVLKANNNLVPDDWDRQVERQEKLYARIPADIMPASNFPDGTIGEENGLRLRVEDGQWRPIGTVKGKK